MLVFMHPNNAENIARPGAPAGAGDLGNVIGNPLETMLFLSHLIFDGTLDRFPGLKICGAHAGGYLPSYLGRNDVACEVRPNAKCVNKRKPHEYLQDQILADSMIFSPEGIRHPVAEMGASQIVYGTDMPVCMAGYRGRNPRGGDSGRAEGSHPRRKPGQATAPVISRIRMSRILLVLLSSVVCLAQANTDSLDKLASDFWTWRAEFRPFTFDDVPRLEHAAGLRDWSRQPLPDSASACRIRAPMEGMRSNGWPVRQMVDYRLMGSALARVRWELDVNPRWQRDPAFYVEQTVGALQEELVPPAPFSDSRSREILERTENIPAILNQARLNLKRWRLLRS